MGCWLLFPRQRHSPFHFSKAEGGLELVVLFLLLSRLDHSSSQSFGVNQYSSLGRTARRRGRLINDQFGSGTDFGGDVVLIDPETGRLQNGAELGLGSLID